MAKKSISEMTDQEVAELFADALSAVVERGRPAWEAALESAEDSDLEEAYEWLDDWMSKREDGEDEDAEDAEETT